MKNTLLFLFLILNVIYSTAQEIYSKAYGSKENPAIIFIHGGPSGNSNLFEGTTAEKLSKEGFYVIVYDRRGEGRSKDENATMTFQESFQDLNKIYKTYDIARANIVAHSFGGIIGTLFTQRFPEKVSSLTLAGALVAQQETYDHILEKGKLEYKNDKDKLLDIKNIEHLDKNSAEYRKACFDLAGNMHYFTMPKPTKESTLLRSQFENSTFYQTNYRNTDSPKRFYKNESHNNLDNKEVLIDIKNHKIPIFAIYGENDNIFSPSQHRDLKNIIGKQNFNILQNCSHYLFVDQQSKFIEFISKKIH